MQTIKIFLIAMTLFLAQLTGGFAQSSVGLRGGFSISTVKNFPIEGVEGTPEDELVFGNYNAIYLEIGLSERFAIQPEVNYVQKGGKVSPSGSDAFFLKVKMDYLEAPILAKLRLGDGPFRGYLIAGPSFGYALNGKVTFKADGAILKDKIDFDNSYGLDGRKDNRFDISAIGGGGIQYQIGRGSIVLDARVALDLNDYNRFEGAKPYGHDATRWQGLAVSLGYQYSFGGI